MWWVLCLCCGPVRLIPYDLGSRTASLKTLHESYGTFCSSCFAITCIQMIFIFNKKLQSTSWRHNPENAGCFMWWLFCLCCGPVRFIPYYLGSRTASLKTLHESYGTLCSCVPPAPAASQSHVFGWYSYSIRSCKPAAPGGVPRRSPTPVLTEPCAN